MIAQQGTKCERRKGAGRMSDLEVETLTRRIGRDIFARVALAGPVPLGPAWWDERLMGLTMGDEQVKLHLFRFVDVLPQLDTPESIVRHLREYFAEAGERVPAWVRW